MGLDMYAYVAAKAGEMNAHYESYSHDLAETSSLLPRPPKPREIAYWRKHPNLHGWMERLAEQKNLDYDSFNGVELELTWEDIEQLERDIRNKKLPGTAGFFFGNNADDHYREDDLAFVRNAKAELFCGLKVFYNSSW
jgi:hypothetical protein